MKRIAANRIRVVYFKRWSRKKYAAFVSMRFNVVISFLKKGVAEASLFKVEKYVRRGEARPFLFQPDDGESKAPPDLLYAFALVVLPSLFSLLLLKGGAAALSLRDTGKGACSISKALLCNKYDCGAVSEIRMQSLLFYPFIIYNYENQRISRKNDDGFISRRCGDCRVPA